MYLLEVNFFAVLLAAIVSMVIGYFWYGPNLFGKTWANSHQFDMESLKLSIWSLIGAFGVGFVMAWIFAGLLNHFAVSGVLSAMCAGFWFWLGFVATTQFSGVIWVKKPLIAYLIDAGFFLVSILAMGFIFGLLI